MSLATTRSETWYCARQSLLVVPTILASFCSLALEKRSLSDGNPLQGIRLPMVVFPSVVMDHMFLGDLESSLDQNLLSALLIGFVVDAFCHHRTPYVTREFIISQCELVTGRTWTCFLPSTRWPHLRNVHGKQMQRFSFTAKRESQGALHWSLLCSC